MKLTKIEERTEFDVNLGIWVSTLFVRFDDIEIYKGTEVRSNPRMYTIQYEAHPKAEDFANGLRLLANKIENEAKKKDLCD